MPETPACPDRPHGPTAGTTPCCERAAWHLDQENLERIWLDEYIRARAPFVVAA